jgi:hypothetical protein
MKTVKIVMKSLLCIEGSILWICESILLNDPSSLIFPDAAHTFRTRV